MGETQDCTHIAYAGKGYPGAMTARTSGLLSDLAAVLNSLPGVFSTPQWGGRVYKVMVGAKAKLVAHVSRTESGEVTVSFKLLPAQAKSLKHRWIEPHSFRTLRPSGWLTATVRTKRQIETLKPLLEDSRRLHDRAETQPKGGGRTHVKRNANAVRIDQVMGELAEDGWSPQSDW